MTTSFPQFTYAPGQKNGPFVFLNDGLDTGTVESLLVDSTNLNLGIVAYELADEDGRSFTHNTTEISARTATIIVDYSDSSTTITTERYQVATNVDQDQLRITVGDVFNKILRMPYEVDSNGSLIGVRSVINEEETDARWAVVHKSTDGVVDTLNLNSTKRGAFDFEDIELRSGDYLQLVYVKDVDGDGLGVRQERAYGTLIEVADTDGDGITDGEEVHTTKTSPTRADSDGDGASDYGEVMTWGTDPWDVDSDDDGILDGDDIITFVSLPPSSSYGSIITARGDLYRWGSSTVFHGMPSGENPVILDDNRRWVEVVAASATVLAVDEDGVLWGWGSNSGGALGLGATASVTEFTEIPGAPRIKKLARGLAIADDDTLWAWNSSNTVPTQMSTDSWTWIATGAGTTALAVKSDGTLWQVSFDTLTQIGTDTGWAQAAVGSSRFAAIKTDGTLYTWGTGGTVPLGYGVDDYSSQSLPTQVGAATDWSSVSAGQRAFYATKNDGSLWTWGNSTYGECTTIGDVFVPTQIGLGSEWVSAHGGLFMAGVVKKADYSLHTVGSDLDGLLGRTTVATCDGDPCSTELVEIDPY